MRFETPLIEARLLRRYKRFLADVELADNGERLTVYCPNTGAMTGCAEPGSRVWLSSSDNPARRYPWTWELVESADGTIVGIHTGRTNAIVAEALGQGAIPEFSAFERIRREARYPGSRRRADFLLQRTQARCWLEVKNVTAAVDGRLAVFPDAVSVRATEHMRALAHRCRAGDQAALLFVAQRADVDVVAPAWDIDPVYSRALVDAARAGVAVLAYVARVAPGGIELDRPLDVELDQ